MSVDVPQGIQGTIVNWTMALPVTNTLVSMEQLVLKIQLESFNVHVLLDSLVI